MQDTGVILGISEAPQSISFAAMAERQQALARVILQDPAVESLSSFIGIDGTNTTLNSGRIQVNLKPLAERRSGAERGDPAAAAGAGAVDGITSLQPVQDLTVDARVSRTQYQYSLEDADGAELRAWAPALLDALRARPELRDVAAISRSGVCRRRSRSTAARRRGSASRRRSSTTRSTTPSASGRSRRSSRS